MALKPIEEVLADTLERIAIALEELVEVQKTQPLEKIIHPSNRRPTIEKEHDLAGGGGPIILPEPTTGEKK